MLFRLAMVGVANHDGSERPLNPPFSIALMKVLIWNVNRTGASRHAVWAIIQREAPDIALLQEVTGLPRWVKERYQSHLVAPRYFSGHRANFKSAILSKWPMDTTPFLASSLYWVNAIHWERCGWLLGSEVMRGDGGRLRLISVHSPVFSIPNEALEDVDVSPINLTNNPKLWFTEILWSLLREADLDKNTGWIVGGDFNSSLLFDVPVDKGTRSHRLRPLLPRLAHTYVSAHGRYGPAPA